MHLGDLTHPNQLHGLSLSQLPDLAGNILKMGQAEAMQLIRMG